MCCWRSLRGDEMDGDMNQFPELSIELRGVQYHVIHAFGEAMDEIKKYAQESIDASMNQLREGGLEKAIIASVERTMDEAIDKGIREAVEEAVAEYFAEGGGKEFIQKAILEYLEKK